MKLNFRDIGSLFKTAFKKWWARDPFRESAIIAYYAIFSLPGLLVVILAIAGYFLGSDTASAQVESKISAAMGANTAEQIQKVIETASESRNSVWASIFGIVTIFIGATGVFVQFQKSLNTIWEVKTDESKSGIWSLVKARLFSFGFIMAFAFIMMVSFVVSTLLMSFGDWLTSYISDTFLVVIKVINFISSRLIIALLFALMFKFFPDAKIKWRHVWLGAIVTAILFFVGMYGLSLYFSKAAPGDAYGVAGSIILILLWVSFSSMIVFFGAEFTNAYAKFYDGTVAPSENAVKQPERETLQV